MSVINTRPRRLVKSLITKKEALIRSQGLGHIFRDFVSQKIAAQTLIYVVMPTTYNSITNDKSYGRKKKNKISQLARDSFVAFEPFINLYDCGLKGYDGPFHLIPKENWRLNERYKAGEKDIVLQDGSEFVPYLDM